MKKIISIVLACMMLLTSAAFNINAADDNVKAYGANSLDINSLIAGTGVMFSLESDGNDAMLHGIITAGTYENNNLQVAFDPIECQLMEYPYIKVAYRTDSKSSVIDISSRSDAGESWISGSSKPACIGDGKWHELVVDMKALTGGAGVPTTNASLVLKPFDSGVVTVPDSYFDIKYVAIADTEASLASYVYTAEKVADTTIEAPEDFFYELADQSLIDKYTAETDALIKEIYATPTDVEVKGTSYYVSNLGDDSNDGLTPKSAWASVSKVNSFEFKDGDAVFFKRGDTWRITSPLNATSGVTYSAYGEGDKPKLVASLDGSGADKWERTGYDNIWRYTEPINQNQDVGTIVFDGGKAWGVQVQKLISKDERLDNGKVFNGRKTFTVSEKEFVDERHLRDDLEFYHNWNSETLYLYCADGNPGDVFASIEIVDKGHGIGFKVDEAVGNSHDIVIDNFEIFGAGSHGIGGGNFVNVTVQNCVLTWIGGSIQGRGLFGRDYGVRYGNAVESYGYSDNFTIRYCYASQVYDCCWTVQNQEAVSMNNVQMYKNVTEFCNTGLEVWNGGGSITNMQLHDNYTRYNGYGWSHQRPTKDGNFFYGSTRTNCTFENNDIYNNVNYFTSTYALLVAATGPEQYNFHDNVYIMENNKFIGGITSNPGAGRGSLRDTKYNEASILKAYMTGFEKGSKFYYTEPEPFGNMYDMYKPFGGASEFTDVSESFWGRDAIDYVALRGLFNGVTPTEFSPDGKMTRAMLVTVLSRLASKDASINGITYTDVNKEAWYVPGVAWAEANGIVDAGGAFRPDDNATREELADMLYRYAKSQYKKIDLSAAKAFTDSASVTAKYADGIKFCTVNGIIGGYTDGSIKPKNNATRAEVATMIQRFVKALSTFEVDADAAIADSSTYTLKGDALKACLDNTRVRATAEADGSLTFTTWLAEENEPIIKVLDSFAKDLSFVDYNCAVVEYDANVSGRIVVGEVHKSELSSSSFSSNAVAPATTARVDGSALLLNYQDYSNAVGDAYSDELVFVLYPWGQGWIKFNSGEYFTIKSITFFDNVVAARAYAGR